MEITYFVRVYFVTQQHVKTTPRQWSQDQDQGTGLQDQDETETMKITSLGN